MESLAWMFFCLSPFALFCSRDGNGFFLCPLFIILGFVFKWLAKNGGKPPKSTVKVSHEEFWEWHYRDRMRSTFLQKKSIDDHLMAVRDQEARRWASAICQYNNAVAPPEKTQEQIARAYGVITEAMIRENNEKKDRIQIGKYFLMNEIYREYKGRNVYADIYICRDMQKLRLSRCGCADDWWVQREYGKTVKEIWESLSQEEKEEAARWAMEYEEKFAKSIRDYEKRIELVVYPVDIEF